MEWGIILGVIALAVAIFAVIGASRLNSRADELSRQIDENRTHFEAFRGELDQQRELIEARRNAQHALSLVTYHERVIADLRRAMTEQQ